NLETLKPCNLALLFFFYPDLITLQMSGNVFDRFDIRDGDRSGDRLDDPFQLLVNVSASGRIHRRGLDLIDQLALGAGDDHHASEMRNVLDGFVFEVDEVRRDKNKEQDQRDHDVVVQA